MKLKIIGFMAICMGILLSGCDSTIYVGDGDEYLTVNPSATANYLHASFAFHVPESDEPLRAILVIVPGYNSDGTYYKDDPLFDSFSTTMNVAILSCYYRGDTETHDYFDATGGSGKALLRAIEEFAYTLDRPEIERLPLLMWGHSAGGMFSYTFMNWKPSMVAGCVVNRSAYFQPEPSDSTRNIPSIFLYGEHDNEAYNIAGMEFCANQRKEGALWSYALEPMSGHDLGLSDYFYVPFFAQVIQSRLDFNTNDYSNMREVEESSGWLGNYGTTSVYAYDEYPDDKSEALWFFNEVIAERWRKYQSGDFSE